MAIVMLVGGAEAGEPRVEPRSARLLAELGVTRLTVLRDGQATAVIVEGWAFDPADGDAVAGVLFPHETWSVRTFRQVADVGLADPA